MNWIKNFVRPKIRSFLGTDKREVPENMWVKDPDSGQMVFYKDLEANQHVMPQSNYHMRMPPEVRLKSMFDDGVFEKIAMPQVAADPLKFRDERKYADRIKEARTKTGAEDCILAGTGELDGFPVTIAVQDFAFMGGSLGMAAGEAFIKAAEVAVARKAALIVITASGGARMQESSFALMQMPRTVLAIQDVKRAKLPYIVILSDPTSGGVLASYAMLGDVQIAEPGAQLAFTGPRVIEATIREKLPEGFQRSEFLRERGMVDIVCSRKELTATVGAVLGMLMPASRGRRSKAVAADDLAAAK